MAPAGDRSGIGEQREAGTALYMVVALLILVLAVSSAFHMITTASSREVVSVADSIRRLYIAESGVVHALYDMNRGGTGNLGSEGAPLSFGGGSYWVTTTENPDGTYSIRSRGTTRGDARVIVAVAQDVSRGVFCNAMFAGNSGGDPGYALELDGTGGLEDDVSGNIYSGGDLVVSGGASVSGTARAVGTVTGITGESGVRLPDLEVSTMRFDVNHDVDVAAEFTDNETWQSAVSGGNAWQVPEELPSHIFRKNPDDRSAETASTTKDDYFLEDPYETDLTGERYDDGHTAYESDVTIAGIPGQPGTVGNDIVYYIDGNLWVQSRQLHRVKFATAPGSGVHVTFVVKGNVYVMDDVTVEKTDKDGLAFVAIRDEGVADSGNVYFGDTAFGVLRKADAFFHAEDTFYEGNIDDEAESTVHLRGLMSAGDRVLIQRDEDGTRSRLNLDFDSRVMDGNLVLPGLPSPAGTGSAAAETIRVQTTMEVSE